MSKLVYVLRWTAVLPAAIVCSILVMFPIHWFVMFIQWCDKNYTDFFSPLAWIPPEILERFGYALFVPMTLISVGAIIAPKFRFQTGIAMAVLVVALLVVSLCFVAFGYIESDMSGLRWSITVLLWLVSISYGLYYSHKKSLE